MKHLIWVTDPHLDRCSPGARDCFLDSLGRLGNSAQELLITGDIGQSHTVETLLSRMADRFAGPVRFVLGNHDFHHGSIEDVRSRVSALARADARLTYLSRESFIDLGDGVALVGHDGWGDACLGNWAGSRVLLDDFHSIQNLIPLSREEFVQKLRELGREAAHHLGSSIEDALQGRATHILVATHVPPFAGASWHEGRLSDDDWRPYFTGKAVGDILLSAARAHPDVSLLVLCGHTHGAGEYVPDGAPNLRVMTGAASLGAPSITGTLDVTQWEMDAPHGES